jgi:dephospho-CoA kinase
MGFRIFVVVGMPGSGKNIARMFAEAKSIPYLATGDFVREEVRRRGLNSTAENTARVSTELRGADGLGVTRLALEAIKKGRGITFLEGMRSWPEIELIRREAEAIVVAFLAPREVRLQRILSRGRADDSPPHFAERDQREIQYGTSLPIALADEYILNTGTTEQAFQAMDSIVNKYGK